MKTPLVTISSAFYNPGNLLLEMLKSVYSQTFEDWEVLLVDDGSTDDSLRIAQSIKDPRVRVVSNGKNLGRSVSLNCITELARGKYIARMDADDLCSPKRIQKQVNLIESNPDLDVVGTGICYLDNQDRPVGESYAKVCDEDICRQPWRTFGLCHGSVLGKREWFKANPYNEKSRYAVDYNLWISSYEHSCFGNVPEPLYYYRLDNSFKLRKQFAARYYSAAFLYKYFRSHRGFAKAIWYAMQQYLKLAATITLFVTGQRTRLMNKRCKLLTPEKIKFYQNEVEYIKSIELPLETLSVSP